MNLLRHPIGRLRRRRGEGCVVCGTRVRDGEPSLRLHGDLLVHRRCATYRRRPGR